MSQKAEVGCSIPALLQVPCRIKRANGLREDPIQSYLLEWCRIQHPVSQYSSESTCGQQCAWYLITLAGGKKSISWNRHHSSKFQQSNVKKVGCWIKSEAKHFLYFLFEHKKSAISSSGLFIVRSKKLKHCPGWVPRRKQICPNRPRRKDFMSRPSFVHQTFVHSFPKSRAFDRFLCVHVQTFVRSCQDFRAFMPRLSCVRQTFVRFLTFPDYVVLNAWRPVRAFIFGLDIHASVRPQPGWQAFLRTNKLKIKSYAYITKLMLTCTPKIF